MSQEQTILLRKIVDGLTGVSPTTGMPVNMTTLIAGENLVRNRLTVEHSYEPKLISAAATISILQSTGGVLHSVCVGMNSCPTITIYDNASGASGTILAHIEPNISPRTYVIDTSFVNGATAYLPAGNTPRVTVNAN